jgi:hypothetical protein
MREFTMQDVGWHESVATPAPTASASPETTPRLWSVKAWSNCRRAWPATAGNGERRH